MGSCGRLSDRMRFFRMFLSGLWLCAFAAHAGMPDYQDFPAAGPRLLLWVASERGRSEPELAAARQLAAQGVEVWSLDSANAYFLPQLPSSMDALPVRDLAAWLRAAQASGKQVVVFAVARAAVPVLRAAALLEAERRSLWTSRLISTSATSQVCACVCCSRAARPPRRGCPACWTIWRDMARP